MERQIGFDLTDKRSWRKGPKVFSDVFGYENDKNFQEALRFFKREVVQPAKCTQFLGVLAIGFLKGYRPPLTPSHRH